MDSKSEVSVSLTPQLQELVQEAVAAGEYDSTTEVIQAALQEWKERRGLKIAAILDLRKKWEEGVASGPAVPLDADALKQDARRRLNAERSRS